MTRALDAILRQPWAVRPEWLHTISEIAAREGDLVRFAERHATTPEALSAKIGGRTEWGTQVRDGVAIIPIGGPIFPRANLMTEFSGATSLDMLALAFEDALANSDISAVLLDIDSPGGVAAGIGEMADMIRAGAARKPVVAYAGGGCCSAAYWLGVAAGELVIHDTAVVGNIGVVAGVRVQENPDAEGYRLIEIVSSNAPDKRPDPRTEEGAATIRAVLDQIEARFVDSVAAFRGVSRETVLQDFGRGSELVGAQAVAAGMADRTGSFEETLAGLAGGEEAATPRQTTTGRRPAMTGKTTVTAAGIAADHPQVADELRAEGRKAGYDEGYAAGQKAGAETGRTEGLAEGAMAERDRVAKLEAVALPGFEALLTAHKADGGKTDVDLMRAQTAAQQKQGGQFLADAKTDEDALAAAAPPAPGAGQQGSGSGKAADPTKPPAGLQGDALTTWCEKQWEGNTALQAEFKTLAIYQAFVTAEARHAA